MRKTHWLIAALIGLLALGAEESEAQRVGSTVSLAGCLVQDEDDADEFVLEDAAGVDADEIELIAGPGVDLAANVGRTVAISGTVIADDDEDGDDGDEGEENELHVRVTAVRHVGPACH